MNKIIFHAKETFKATAEQFVPRQLTEVPDYIQANVKDLVDRAKRMVVQDSIVLDLENLPPKATDIVLADSEFFLESSLEMPIVAGHQLGEMTDETHETGLACEEEDELLPLANNEVLPDQQWHAIQEAVLGLSRSDVTPPLPCQDYCIAKAELRPVLMLADGAGASAVSNMAAKQVAVGLARLINTLEKQLKQLLDFDQFSEQEIKEFGMLLVKHALGILQDQAHEHARSLQDFCCTLQLVIHGKERLLWLKVGDGALVVERIRRQEGQELESQLSTLGAQGQMESGAEVALLNAQLTAQQVKIGVVPSRDITGIALVSNGAAERLVTNDGSQVAPLLASWFAQLRLGTLTRRIIAGRFHANSFTNGSSGDDTSIAMLASGLLLDLQNKD